MPCTTCSTVVDICSYMLATMVQCLFHIFDHANLLSFRSLLRGFFQDDCQFCPDFSEELLLERLSHVPQDGVVTQVERMLAADEGAALPQTDPTCLRDNVNWKSQAWSDTTAQHLGTPTWSCHPCCAFHALGTQVCTLLPLAEFFPERDSTLGWTCGGLTGDT